MACLAVVVGRGFSGRGVTPFLCCWGDDCRGAGAAKPIHRCTHFSDPTPMPPPLDTKICLSIPDRQSVNRCAEVLANMLPCGLSICPPRVSPARCPCGAARKWPTICFVSTTCVRCTREMAQRRRQCSEYLHEYSLEATSKHQRASQNAVQIQRFLTVTMECSSANICAEPSVRKVCIMGAGLASPVVSTISASRLRSCCNSYRRAKISVKSERTVQHKHPLLARKISSSPVKCCLTCVHNHQF